jgi:ribosomal protein S18 acetylase RimI-like enzyme
VKPDAVTIAPESDAAQRRRIVEDLTRRLPQWFGRPEANRNYAEQAENNEAWVARASGRPFGLLQLKRHGPGSAEIYWLGVAPEYHRRGAGRALVAAAERRLKEQGTRFLFVSTLHPDVDYEPYRRTRAFYEALRFTFVLSSAEVSDNPLAWYLKLLDQGDLTGGDGNR